MRRLSIRIKFLMVPIATSAVLIALAGGFFHVLKEQEKLISNLNQQQLEKILDLSTLYSQLTVNQIGIFDALIAASRGEIDRSELYDLSQERLDMIHALIDRVHRIEKNYELTPDERSYIRGLVLSMNSYLANVISAISLASVDLNRAYGSIAKANFNYKEADIAFGALLDASRRQAALLMQSVSETTRRRSLYVSACTALSIFFLILAGLFGSHLLSKPILQIANRIGRITEHGGLDEKIPVLSRDEIGFLAESFNQMLERLNKSTLEVQRSQARKLEAIGRLAAGIAHEINTPMQYVETNTRFLKDSFKSVSEIYMKSRTEPSQDRGRESQDAISVVSWDFLSAEIPKAIDQSLEGIRHISEIIGALKEFSHPGNLDKAPSDLNRALQTTLIVARNEWRYVAEVTTEFDADLPLVSCMPGEINQVFLNLIVNAARAISEKHGGKEMGEIKIVTKKDGQFAVIRISDTGNGIPDEIREKIFEPFFTTKDVCDGVGQGLAIVWSLVVDKHQGSVGFESRVGVGTTFTIRLPLGDGA